MSDSLGVQKLLYDVNAFSSMSFGLFPTLIRSKTCIVVTKKHTFENTVQSGGDI